MPKENPLEALVVELATLEVVVGAPKEKAGFAGWLALEAVFPNPPNPPELEVCEGAPKLKVDLFSFSDDCEGAPKEKGVLFFSSVLPLAGAPKLKGAGEELDPTGAVLAAGAPKPVKPRFCCGSSSFSSS